MKRIKVSNNVIRRLPRYLRKLDELTEAGVSRISSGELGRQLGLTPSQIRQDFSCFGEFGQQGYGYKVTALRAEIASILGMDRGFTAVLIGVGNIGQALMCNFSFKNWGFDLKAAFDIKPELIGTEYEGVPIFDMKVLPEYLAENHVDVVVLCVPKEHAVSTTEMLTKHGINAIWNFTNVELTAPESRTIVENIHFSDSLLSLSYYIADDIDEKAARAARLNK
ncbi:MAG: redox-sensing transcriptional repressor Rex [Oscillospiraceae bacterium]|nr:redox-sensing transcriptional repressor Rex [Oscillospiraceae bacterium]